MEGKGENKLSRIEEWREKKREKNRQKNLKYNEKNREKRAAYARERRHADKTDHQQTRQRTAQAAKKSKKLQEKKEKKAVLETNMEKVRRQTRERVKKLREKKKQIANAGEVRDAGSQANDNVAGFRNRMAASRAVKKVKKALPETPEKRAEIMKKIGASPRTRKHLVKAGIMTTPEEEKESKVLKAMAADIKEGLEEVKRSGSNEKRTALRAFKSLAFGQNVKKSRAQCSLAKVVSLNRKSIGRGIKRRMEILKGEEPSWLVSKRKVRFDAVPEEVKRNVYDFWTTQASRPTGDKKDFVRYRTGKSQYTEHAKHILEKSQTEAFLEFQALYPGVKIKQRKFESLKPFFVKAAKERDRKSCLCRKHVEIKIVLGDCMKFRKAALKERDHESVNVLATITEAAELTLCPKAEEDPYHKLACLERECEHCGVHLMKLLPEEESIEGTVIWRRYDYVSTGKFLANGQEKKKLALVTKETPPSEMFGYFKNLMKDYPMHSFMAKWQRDQLDTLLEHLPIDHAVAIHDYSEGYTCRSQDETQSEYFDVAKVSLHVTILYRHATEVNDGIESTEENPEIVKEHVFVISDDVIQDNSSVHKVQELLNNYITNDLGQQVKIMHEFTDGCAAQYKSRHCLGDLSCCVADFGFKVQRNFFETSHAKGEQDAAGSHVKQKVSQAVLRRTAAIKSAKDMHTYLTESFTLPTASSFLSRTKSVNLKQRLFFYVPASGEGSVNRNRPERKFREIKGIRKIHAVKCTTEQGKVYTRERSCYCLDCLLETGDSCANSEWVDDWKELKIEREASPAITRNAQEDTVAVTTETAVRIADLAVAGSVVAVAADADSSYDYYLLKVNSDGVEELAADVTDAYGSIYNTGQEVLKGNFFLRDNLIDMTYKLDESKVAIVHAATVRHICSDLRTVKRGRKSVYRVPVILNEEILASM